MQSPTNEQQHALELFRTGEPLKISAFAGAGKTSTLKHLAGSRSSRGVYLAFNRAIAAEARESFPNTVNCRTTHSIAWGAVQNAHRFTTGKMTGAMFARQLAEQLELRDLAFDKKFRLEGVPQARLMLRTIKKFCYSAESVMSAQHVPRDGRLAGLSDDLFAEVVSWTLRESRTLWARMTDHQDRLPLGHDGYLKIWSLGQPRMGFDYILLDEAQDTNPAVLDVLTRQQAQVVYVGDRHQQIYEWRGAVNAMSQIDGCAQAYLTLSFRFGPVVADEASKVLGTLGETHLLRGNSAKQSTVSADGPVNAVLARTNATVILEVLQAISAGRQPYVVGGTEELKRLLSDVFELKNNKPAACPEFFGFASWNEVVAFAGSEEGEDIRTFVQLIEQNGEHKLWAAVNSAEQSEEKADIVLSTAHKAKGREWDAVRLAPDFLSSRLNGADPNAEAEVRLFYVAMTRAREHLVVDPDMLATFTSGAWRTRVPEKREARSAQRQSSRAIEPPRLSVRTPTSPSAPAPPVVIVSHRERPPPPIGNRSALASLVRPEPTSPLELAPTKELLRETREASTAPGARGSWWMFWR